MLSAGTPGLTVPVRHLLIGGAAFVLIAYAAMAAGIYTANKDKRIAETRYLDMVTLVEAPPPQLEPLRAELQAAQATLAELQRASGVATIDPSSDEATALLVRRAQEGGLAVKGVARLDAAETKVGDVDYGVDAIRINVEGTREQVFGFLGELRSSDPALIPTLTFLDVLDSGDAGAEIVFSAYTAIVPEDEPGAAAP